MALQLVLFDLDGTLIDSLPDLVSAVNHLLSLYQRPALDGAEISRMVGDGALHLIQRAFAARGGFPDLPTEQVLQQFLDHYQAHSVVETRPFPQVPQTLAALRQAGVHLAVCTNKPSAATHAILRALDLDQYFDLVAGSDDVPHIKPHPDHIHFVLRQLSIEPAHAIMVGDSHNDILAARAAGISSIAVRFGYAHGPVEELGADRLADSFPHLLSMLVSGG